MSEPKPISLRLCTIDEWEANPVFHTLVEEYARECAIAGLPHPRPRFDIYKAMGDASHPIGVFLGDELVGFAVLLTPTIPHYGIMIGVTESLFVSKPKRKTGAGLKLIADVKRRAKEAGSPGVIISAPTGSDLAELLPMLEFDEVTRAFFHKFGGAE